MNHKFTNSRPIAVVVFVFASLTANLVAAQISDPTVADGYTLPRTADGHPDFDGFWSNATYTPMQRRDGVAGEFYTAEEVAAIEARMLDLESAQTVPGTTADVHYDFTQFGLDRSQATLATGLRTSLIYDPPDGRIPALTAEGQRIMAAREEQRRLRGAPYDAAENMNLSERCLIMRGSGPPMLDVGYNTNYQFVQNQNYVMILVEMIHDTRIIPLDGREQADAKISQWMGSSRGHWEGDTLVVETANFNGKNPLYGSTDNMRVTERFTRIDDATLVYRFTIDDASMWTRPWSAELLMKKTIGPIFEHACHEGNYGMSNTLAGARLEEQLVEEETAAQ